MRDSRLEEENVGGLPPLANRAPPCASHQYARKETVLFSDRDSSKNEPMHSHASIEWTTGLGICAAAQFLMHFLGELLDRLGQLGVLLEQDLNVVRILLGVNRDL